MNGKAREPFNRSLPIYGLIGAAIVALPTLVFGNDIGTFLASALVAAMVCLALLIVFILGVRHQSIAALAMGITFCAASWLLFNISNDVRWTVRWLAHSSTYKAEVLGQATPPDGELKHAGWDGWGFAGAGDTEVYLVFDPSNSLAGAATSRSPGKYNGIPCEVPNVHRLQSQWYTVTFYTDSYWEMCSETRSSPR